MRKRRFYINEDEGLAIQQALRLIILKNPISGENITLEHILYIEKIEKIYRKLSTYQWEVEV